MSTEQRSGSVDTIQLPSPSAPIYVSLPSAVVLGITVLEGAMDGHNDHGSDPWIQQIALCFHAAVEEGYVGAEDADALIGIAVECIRGALVERFEDARECGDGRLARSLTVVLVDLGWGPYCGVMGAA